MRLIFAGSSTFGLPSLQLLERQNVPLLVISPPDKAAGRNLRLQPCPVADYARRVGLDLFQPPDVNAPDSLSRIREFAPDLLITASYGGMIRRELRNLPRCGAVNLHPSLLPKYRGATPIQSALLNGDTITGVSIFRLNARMDAGPILMQHQALIIKTDDFGSLHNRLANLSALMLQNLMPQLESGSCEAIAQDDSAASYTRKLSKEDLQLDWYKPANEVLNQIRAFSPQPGAQAWLREKPLKILAAQLVTEPASGYPGTVAALIRNTGVEVNCGVQRLLLTRVQAAGKKEMDAWPWQLGARLSIGESLNRPSTFKPSNPLQEEE